MVRVMVPLIRAGRWLVIIRLLKSFNDRGHVTRLAGVRPNTATFCVTAVNEPVEGLVTVDLTRLESNASSMVYVVNA